MGQLADRPFRHQFWREPGIERNHISVLIGGQSAGPNSHISALEHLPAYTLTYSGPSLIEQGVNPLIVGIDGSSGAVVTNVFGMPAPVAASITPQRIVAWYAAQAQAQSWTISNLGNEAQYQAQQEWANQGDYLHVGVYDPISVQDYVPHLKLNTYPMVFEIDLGELNYNGS